VSRLTTATIERKHEAVGGFTSLAFLPKRTGLLRRAFLFRGCLSCPDLPYGHAHADIVREVVGWDFATGRL
jgi:hypothetical protein